jgi:hypothetical protein
MMVVEETLGVPSSDFAEDDSFLACDAVAPYPYLTIVFS